MKLEKQHANKLAAIVEAAVLDRPAPLCTCWIGRGDEGGWAPDRQACAVHADSARADHPAPEPVPQPEIDAVWKAIEQGWDIEPRSYFEEHAPTNGFKYPLAQAIHHLWKRCVKENPDFLRAGAGPAAALPPTTSETPDGH